LGTILRTTDGGSNWIGQDSRYANPLNDVSFTDSVNGTAVGYYGTILRTTNGGVTFVEANNEISLPPTAYFLYQNYPNPFNPSTKIEFRITDLEFVSLKVYDILGNEITTLLNEELPAGEHAVEFNGLGLSSGIYFYQLRAGSLLETKKMILLR